MMKCLVLGVGRMGTAIAYAMDKFGFEVMGMDVDLRAADNLPQKNFLVVDNSDDIIKGLSLLSKFDIVISSLPYHQTEKVGLWCVDNGVRYCDLGGRVDVSQNINEAAKDRATVPVFTDLGLAPGLVNILAEEGCRQIHENPESVKMMVGGLPDYSESTRNPLRYGVTWSVDGLINEYIDDCLILENGKIKTVKGMDGLEEIEGEKFGKMEAFYTSGGASHSIHSMKERGVRNCFYKTIRYKGHRDIVNFLMRDCNLNDDVMEQIFVHGCGYADKDEVIVVAEVSGGDKVWKKEILIKSNERFSAMQQATAFPISSVAALMAEGAYDGDRDQRRDYYTQYNKNLSYKDVNFDLFKEKLDILGCKI